MNPRPEVLLPGVDGREGANRSSIDAQRAIAAARRKEDLRDIIDLLLLAAVDALMFYWESAHIPLLSRATTLKVMLVVNAGVALYLFFRRAIPLFRARRIARTWSAQEQRQSQVEKKRRP